MRIFILLSCLIVPVCHCRVTFKPIGGIALDSLSLLDLVTNSSDQPTIEACAMACSKNNGCGGFVFNNQQAPSSVSLRTCYLASLCQLQRWLRESLPRWPPEAADCLVHASVGRDRENQLSSGLSPNLANDTVIYANFRDSAVATANYRNVCQTELGSLSNVQQVPQVGLQFAGSVESFVNIDTKPFASAMLTEVTIFLKATRTLSDTGVHYVWGSRCGGNDEVFVLREYLGQLSLLLRANNEVVDRWLAPTPTEMFIANQVTIGVSTNFVKTLMYFNGTLVNATVGGTGYISTTLNADTMQCMFLGKTPYNSKRCLNGTLHCFHMLRRAVSSDEMLLLASRFCNDESNQPLGVPSFDDACTTGGI